MPEVYAVFAMGMGYYDRSELVKIFGAMAAADDYAETLREMVDEDGEAEFALVKVESCAVN